MELLENWRKSRKNNNAFLVRYHFYVNPSYYSQEMHIQIKYNMLVVKVRLEEKYIWFGCFDGDLEMAYLLACTEMYL